MDDEPVLLGDAAHNAWLASIAHAAGDAFLTEDYLAMLVLALGTTFPNDAEMIYDAGLSDRLHGASGTW